MLNLARERYAKEKKVDEPPIANEEEAVGIKEKDYLLKTLGVLIKFYVQKQNNSRLGDFKNVNISQVVNDVLQFLEDNEIKIYGLEKGVKYTHYPIIFSLHLKRLPNLIG